MIFRKTILLLTLFAGPIPVLSQENMLAGMKAQLDTMFANLDKSKVPTGFLWDTSANRVQTIVIPIHPLITSIPLEM